MAQCSGTALKGLEISDLTGNWPFSYQMLALSNRGGQEMKPRHAPASVLSCSPGLRGNNIAAFVRNTAKKVSTHRGPAQ